MKYNIYIYIILYYHSKITALWCHLVSSLFLSPRSTLQLFGGARCEATKRTQNIQYTKQKLKKLVRSDQHISHSISQPMSHLVNLLTSIMIRHPVSFLASLSAFLRWRFPSSRSSTQVQTRNGISNFRVELSQHAGTGALNAEELTNTLAGALL